MVGVVTVPPTGTVQPVKVKFKQRFQTMRYFVSVYSIFLYLTILNGYKYIYINIYEKVILLSLNSFFFFICLNLGSYFLYSIPTRRFASR